MSDLKPCGCGKTPDKLMMSDADQGGKWARVAGDCCGAWVAEFHTGYESLDSAQCRKYAVQAWNELPRMEPAPALPDEAQAIADYLRGLDNPKDAELIERLARENEQLLQNINRLVKSNDDLRRVLGDKRAEVEKLEDMRADEIVRWMRRHPKVEELESPTVSVRGEDRDVSEFDVGDKTMSEISNRGIPGSKEALSPTLPDDVQGALEWLSEFRGEDAEYCKKLIKRLAQENAALVDENVWLQKAEAKVKELESQLSTCRRVLNDYFDADRNEKEKQS